MRWPSFGLSLAGLALPLVWACAAGVGCSSKSGAAAPSLPLRSCALTVWYRPSSADAHVTVEGSWDAWASPGRTLVDTSTPGWRASQWELAPGDYAYGIIEDGTWVADPSVPTTTYHDGTEVSWVSIPNCDVPAVQVNTATGSTDGTANIAATFVSARVGAALDPATVTVATLAGAPVVARVTTDAAHGVLSLAFAGLPSGKNTVVVSAKDTAGRAAETARVSLWIEPRAWDPRDTSIYEVMVDRYRDANGNALAEPTPVSARAGGHVDGVTKAIESGELQGMGFNTIWLTPLYANPDGMWPGSDGELYSSYHGYWPIAPRSLEPKIADEPSVDALVAAAHARGLRVLFDVVPHHVDQSHPYYVAHQNDGWFTDVTGDCICGNGTCDWATHIEDCWFTPYLPSLDWQVQDVADQVSSDVFWWLDRFDGDGIRIDAVPMMPRAATRRIVWNIRSKLDYPAKSEFLLGENFTGPGGWDLIRYDLGPFGLDSEFDFPTLWTLRSTLGTPETTGLDDLDATIKQGQASWAGSGAVMGMIIGNHDVSRFASVAAGDGDGDPWTPAVQSTDPTVYARQEMALAVVYTVPGAPVVYYGDEVALAGHADPDSRRVLPADDALSALQMATKAYVTSLGRARACVDALRYGGYRTIAADAEHLVYARESAGLTTAFVVLQRNVTEAYSTPLPGIGAGSWVDLLSGGTVNVDPAGTVFAPHALTAAIYVPAGSACSGS